MATIRTQIKEAIFERLLNVTFESPINGHLTWVETGRRLKIWTDVDPSRQPGMFLVQHREGVDTSHTGTPNRRWMRVSAWCYCRAEEGQLGDDFLDLMVTGIEAQFLPDDPIRNELTLGGLCWWCRIDREDNLYIREPGDMDNQALLILPFAVMIP